jgi:hypothetical protein
MAERTLPISKRGFNFETFMWVFTRFTVIAMYGLLLAGIIGGLIVSAQTGANLGDLDDLAGKAHGHRFCAVCLWAWSPWCIRNLGRLHHKRRRTSLGAQHRNFICGCGKFDRNICDLDYVIY